MKKNTSLIIVAVVALAIGYLLGSNIGTGNNSQTKGDINALNTYNQLLISPEYMCFNKDMVNNQESIDKTIRTLQIVVQRIVDYRTLADMMDMMGSSDDTMAQYVEQFVKNEENSKAILTKAQQALQVAQRMKMGEKADTKKALKDAEAAFEYLTTQIQNGKQFIEDVDKQLKGKDVKEYIVIASVRDLVASHCAVNASLTQDEREIDYWCNLSELVERKDMTLGVE